MQATEVAGNGQQAAVIQTVKGDTSLDPIRNSPEFRQVFGPRPPAQPNGPDKTPPKEPTDKAPKDPADGDASTDEPKK